MDKVERTVQLDRDAADLLIKLAGGKRKQGEYLSGLIRAAGAKEIEPRPLSKFEQLEAQVQELAAELARLREEQSRATE